MELIPGKLYTNIYYGDLTAYTGINNKVLRIPPETILLYLKSSFASNPFIECFFIYGTIEISFILSPRNLPTYFGEVYY